MTIGVEQRDSGSTRKYWLPSEEGVREAGLHPTGDSGVNGDGGLSFPGFRGDTGDAGRHTEARDAFVCVKRFKMDGVRARRFGENSSSARWTSSGSGTEPIFGVVGRESPPLNMFQGDICRAGRYRQGRDGERNGNGR